MNYQKLFLVLPVFLLISVLVMAEQISIKGSDTIVQVQPAIPTADSYALRVLMHGVAPDAWTLTSCVDTYPYIGALRSYVQAAALAGQVESAAALAASGDHMKRFVALMGATKQADAEVAREAQ
jgi:hypothetical protein